MRVRSRVIPSSNWRCSDLRRPSDLNPLTAPPPVLAALPGMDPARLTAFLDARAQPGDPKQQLALLGFAQTFRSQSTHGAAPRAGGASRNGPRAPDRIPRCACAAG